MFKFIRDNLLLLILLFFISFYLSYAFMVGTQIIGVHWELIKEHNPGRINISFITFIVFAFLPILLWKMSEPFEIPILRETSNARLVLSIIAIIFTACLFISKSIYNSLSREVMSWETTIFLDTKGRVVLIELLSVAFPLVVFLYATKKYITYFVRKSDE